MPQTNASIQIRSADYTDADSIAAIYNHYVENSTITFEELVVTAEEMAKRIEDVRSKQLPWYLAVEGEAVVGYAHATPWKSRSAYRFSVEVTVYVANGHGGRGIGTRLYTVLLAKLRESFHTAIAGIALPNPASVALHERLGFERVAHFSQVGFKMDRWVDVGYWQHILNADIAGPLKLACLCNPVS